MASPCRAGEAWRKILDEPGPVVLGSTQLASCFGPYYELAFEMDWELRKRKMRHKVPTTYLTSEPYPGHMGIGGLGNPRGVIPADQHFRHPQHANIYTVGVAMALALLEPTPVPTGVPKTGFMTVRMAKAAAANIAADLRSLPPPAIKDLRVICMMDMGRTAALMVADPLLPPRQKSYIKKALWAKWAKIQFESYFLWKMRHGYSRLP